MNRILMLITVLIPAGALVGNVAAQRHLREADRALSYSCGYLARTALDSPMSLSEDDFCRTYRLSAISRGFSPALDAYPKEPRP